MPNRPGRIGISDATCSSNRRTMSTCSGLFWTSWSIWVLAAVPVLRSSTVSMTNPVTRARVSNSAAAAAGNGMAAA